MPLPNQENSPKPPAEPVKPPPNPPPWVFLAFVLLLVLGTVVPALAVYAGSHGFSRPAAQPATVTVPISRLANLARDGSIQRIVVEGDAVQAELRDGSKIRTRKEAPLSVPETLQRYGVSEQQIAELVVEVRQPADWLALGGLIWWVPLLFVFWLVSRAPPGASSGGMGRFDGFGRSHARQASLDRPLVRFDDVAGVDEAKQELAEIVDFLRQPAKFAALGARIPKGVLVVGPPGTGKTLLARAVAGEAGVPFFSINASEFVELFVGVGASRVRNLFRQAREAAPAIIFIDEIDAIGRRRGTGLTQSHEEREQTLNQILAELDGFDPRINVVVMAATNRPDVLDPALLRPGRFDRRVVVENPDRDGRLAILTIHGRGKPLSADVELAEVAKATVGFSGADLENLLNEAALLAARRERAVIGREELEEAAVVVGSAVHSRDQRLGRVDRPPTASFPRRAGSDADRSTDCAVGARFTAA